MRGWCVIVEIRMGLLRMSFGKTCANYSYYYRL